MRFISFALTCICLFDLWLNMEIDFSAYRPFIVLAIRLVVVFLNFAVSFRLAGRRRSPRRHYIVISSYYVVVSGCLLLFANGLLRCCCFFPARARCAQQLLLMVLFNTYPVQVGLFDIVAKHARPVLLVHLVYIVLTLWLSGAYLEFTGLEDGRCVRVSARECLCSRT
jgi:hypothetical protein